MTRHYDKFDLTFPELGWSTFDSARQAIIKAVASAYGSASLVVVDEHNGRIGGPGSRPESIGRIGWMTQLTAARVSIDSRGVLTELPAECGVADLCVAFVRRQDGPLPNATLVDTTARFRANLGVHLYTSLPYPVTVNATAEREGLKLEVVVDPDRCSPGALRSALSAHLAQLGRTRRSMFAVSLTLVNPHHSDSEVYVFLPGNDGCGQRLRPLYDGLSRRSVLVQIDEVPEDLKPGELERLLAAELAKISGGMVALVGWSFGAYLAHSLANEFKLDAVLVDPPHADSGSHHRRSTSELVSERASRLARCITRAFATFEYNDRDPASQILAFFSPGAGGGAFLAKYPRAIAGSSIVSSADHDSILCAPQVRRAITSIRPRGAV